MRIKSLGREGMPGSVPDAENSSTVETKGCFCVRRALEKAASKAPESILDFGCGHGRVLRSLAADFPRAGLTAADVDADYRKSPDYGFSLSSPDWVSAQIKEVGFELVLYQNNGWDDCQDVWALRLARV